MSNLFKDEDVLQQVPFKYACKHNKRILLENCERSLGDTASFVRKADCDRQLVLVYLQQSTLQRHAQGYIIQVNESECKGNKLLV